MTSRDLYKYCPFTSIKEKGTAIIIFKHTRDLSNKKKEREEIRSFRILQSRENRKYTFSAWVF